MASVGTVTNLTIQKGLFDLKTMDTVTLKKTVPFQPVDSVQAANERLGNNLDKLIEVINRGLQAHTREAAINDNSQPWMVEDEEGNLVPFDGIPADEKLVNGLILNLAKSLFGYNKDMEVEEKRAAKESAVEMIRNTPAIRDGLQKQAEKALSSGE